MVEGDLRDGKESILINLNIYLNIILNIHLIYSNYYIKLSMNKNELKEGGVVSTFLLL